MASRDIVFSSLTVEWGTPQGVFDVLDREFNFNLDPCATKQNAKCKKYFTLEDDGLSQTWSGSVFMNPPYGRVIGHWVQKAFEASQGGATVVCLLPARTDTRWWHDYIMQSKDIRFIRGRLRFGDGEGRATFPSCVVVFRPRKKPNA